jgi:hypothetical protein
MDSLTNLVCGVVSILAVPTFLLLLLRMLVPSVGEPILRAYGQLLAWLVVAPIRLVQLLVREAFGRRH